MMNLPISLLQKLQFGESMTQENTTPKNDKSPVLHPQFSAKEMIELQEIYTKENVSSPNQTQALFLHLYKQVMSQIELSRNDKSLLKSYIQIHRSERSRQRAMQKLMTQQSKKQQSQRKRLEHLKFLLGGFLMSDEYLAHKPQMPYLVELLLVAWGIRPLGKVGEVEIKQSTPKDTNTTSYYIQTGNTYHQLVYTSQNNQAPLWCYRILEQDPNTQKTVERSKTPLEARLASQIIQSTT